MMCEICGKGKEPYEMYGDVWIEGAGLSERHVLCGDCIREMNKFIENEIEKRRNDPQYSHKNSQ